MISFKFAFNLIVVFVCCVNSSVVNKKSIDIKVANLPTFSGGSIGIPVAVVFDDGNRKEKSVEIKNSVTEKENSLKNATSENKTETIVSPTEEPTKIEPVEKKSETKLMGEEEKAVTNKNNNTETGHSLENATSEKKTETIVSSTEEPKNIEPVAMKSDTKLASTKETVKPNIDKSSTERVSVNTNTKLLLNREKELQIPVAVVYDEPKLVVGSGDKLNGRRQSKKIDKTNDNQLKRQPEKVVYNQTENKNNTSRDFRKKIQVPIVQSENYVYSHNGDFHYSYESGDGTKASERGILKSIENNTGEAVVGSFSYVGKDGNDYSLTYTADENGYRPVGAHLPTPPPIPPAIARALKYLATKTTPEPVTEPSK